MVCPNRPNHEVKHYDTSKAHIIASAERSLRNLKTDFLDLLLIHRPSPLMDAAEVAEAFSSLHESGKVRFFGVSNFSPSQFEVLQKHHPLVTNQIQCSLLHMLPLEDGTLDQQQYFGIKPMIWSPLASGKVFRDQDNEKVARIRSEAIPLMEKYGLELDQLLLVWLMSHPVGMLPVLGTAKIERIKKAVACVEKKLERADWFKLWQAAKGHEVP